MREWLIKDFWWKLFSVFLAIAVWVTIHKYRQDNLQPGPAGIEITYNDVPVAIVSAAGDVHDFRVAPATVSVTVSGSREVMGILQANQVHAFADVTTFDPMAKSMRQRVEISTPAGVSLKAVDPAQVGIILPPKKQ